MRSNLILSIFLTTVIANPVLRRANQAENDSGIINLSADVDKVTEDGGVGKALPVGGEEVSDLNLDQKIKEILALKKKAGKLSDKVEVSTVLAKVKELISLKKATSLTEGGLLEVIDEVLSAEVKAEDEDLKLGGKAKSASAEGSG